MAAAVPSEVWMPPANIEDLFASTSGNQFAAINRPTAGRWIYCYFRIYTTYLGAREEKALPEGKAPIQLYMLIVLIRNLFEK